MKTTTTLFILCLTAIQFCNAQFISTDDKLHFGTGALISATTYTVVYSVTKNKKKAFWYSFGMATLAGLSKEIYDSTKKLNRFDTGELVATSLGGLTMSTTINLFVGKRKKKTVALVN